MTEHGQEVVQRTPQQELARTIEGDYFREQIAKALPANVTVDRFQRSLLTAVMQNPDLAKADQNSVLLAAIRAAQDGLLPDGREAAIAAFGGQATYMPMIGGLRKALADYGWTLRTRVVYQGDEFDFTEEPATIHHKPAPPSEGRGQLIYAYAIATHKDGRRLQRVAFPDEIAKRKAIAKSKNVWEKWPAEMWEKTAGHMLFDEVPLGDYDEGRERLARIMAAWEGDPVKAVDAIYGPATDTPQLAAPAALDPPMEPEEDAAPVTSAAPEGEQAGGGGRGGVAAAAGSSPDPEPPLAAPAEEPALRVPAVVVEQSAQVVIAGQGLTIEQILERDGAETWIGWALRGNLEDDVERSALELVVRERRPELWAEISEAA